MLKHTVIPDLLKRDNIEWSGDWKNTVAIDEKAIDLLTDGISYPSTSECDSKCV
jgi:hypothetical protein